MITEILPTLQIHKLTQEQYDRELANGNINEHAIYLTPNASQDIPTLPSGTDLNEIRSVGDYYLNPGNTYENSVSSGLAGILHVTSSYPESVIHQVIENTSGESDNSKFERKYFNGTWRNWKNTTIKANKLGTNEGLLVIPANPGYMVVQWGRASMTVKANSVSSVQVNLPHAYKNTYDYEVFANVYNKIPNSINSGCYDLKVNNFKVYCHSSLTGDASASIGWMAMGFMETDPRYTL